eukprot:scaffold48948_cov50-Phaeocystis_antarctica.AAC.2
MALRASAVRARPAIRTTVLVAVFPPRSPVEQVCCWCCRTVARFVHSAPSSDDDARRPRVQLSRLKSYTLPLGPSPSLALSQHVGPPTAASCVGS